jgi:hypothetical protein
MFSLKFSRIEVFLHNEKENKIYHNLSIFAHEEWFIYEDIIGKAKVCLDKLPYENISL